MTTHYSYYRFPSYWLKLCAYHLLNCKRFSGSCSEPWWPSNPRSSQSIESSFYLREVDASLWFWRCGGRRRRTNIWSGLWATGSGLSRLRTQAAIAASLCRCRASLRPLRLQRCLGRWRPSRHSGTWKLWKFFQAWTTIAVQHSQWRTLWDWTTWWRSCHQGKKCWPQAGNSDQLWHGYLHLDHPLVPASIKPLRD